MKKNIIFSSANVMGQSFQVWYDYRKDILIIMQDGENIATGQGLWRVFNKFCDKVRDNKITEVIGEVISDIDINVSSLDL